MSSLQASKAYFLRNSFFYLPLFHMGWCCYWRISQQMPIYPTKPVLNGRLTKKLIDAYWCKCGRYPRNAEPALARGDSIHAGFPGKFGKLRCQMNISPVHFDEIKT